MIKKKPTAKSQCMQEGARGASASYGGGDRQAGHARLLMRHGKESDLSWKGSSTCWVESGLHGDKNGSWEAG